MEYIDEGNKGLMHQIKCKDQPYTHGEVLQILMQILPTLKYLESTEIMHRDLTPMHILTTREGNNPIIARLSGFNCAVNIEEAGTPV